MNNYELTTIQISKKTLKKVSAYCRKNGFIQRYWVEGLLERALKSRQGSGQAPPP